MLGSVFEKVKDDTKLHVTATLSLPPCSLGFLCLSFVNVMYLGIELGRAFCGTKQAGHCIVGSHRSVYCIAYRPSSHEEGTL